MTGEPVGVPAPCLRCGAPMLARGTDTLHADPQLSCPYCKAVEVLPPDAAAQHRFLRLRLVQVRRAREAAEAPLATYALVRQAWLGALAPLCALAVWHWSQLATLAQTTSPSTVVFALASVAATLGLVVGYVGMARAFRRIVRPLLAARPPLERGLAARCRTCNAPLPIVRGPSATCEHCSATNFLDQHGAHGVSSALAAEIAVYSARAAGIGGDGSAPFRLPNIAFRRWAFAGSAAAFVAASIALYAVAG